MILVIAEFMHNVCAMVLPDDVRVIVLSGVTVIEPLAVTVPQLPVRVTV